MGPLRPCPRRAWPWSGSRGRCRLAPHPDPEAPLRTVAYAEHPDTVLDLHPPTAPASGVTVALVHGGFWREPYRRDLMDPLVPSLAGDGHVVVNLEYRRVGGAGGWPTTLLDVAAALDATTELGPVDPGRVVVVGHSAGGHLALWAAARHRLPDGAPGAGPRLRPVGVVALAPVADLGAAHALGDGAVAGLTGEATPGPRHAVADPARLLPTGVPVVLVHGDADEHVPVAQSERHLAAAAAAGDDARLDVGPGDHFAVIDPRHERWAAARAAVAGLVPGAA